MVQVAECLEETVVSLSSKLDLVEMSTWLSSMHGFSIADWLTKCAFHFMHTISNIRTILSFCVMYWTSSFSFRSYPFSMLIPILPISSATCPNLDLFSITLSTDNRVGDAQHILATKTGKLPFSKSDVQNSFNLDKNYKLRSRDLPSKCT